MAKKYHDFILLSLIVLLGVILRLHHFNFFAIWNDEAFAANILSNNLLNLWSATFETANNPTFIYLLKIWTEFFGTSAVAMRLMSIFFGLLSIIAINYLGKLLFGRKAGLWASFLLAISYAGIFYSIQARPYSLIIFLTILSYYYFSRLILGQKKKGTVYLYILFTILGLYAHPWFFFLLPAQLLTVFILNRAEAKKIFIWQLICLFVSVPLLLKILDEISSGANTWIPMPTLKTILETSNYFTYGAQFFYIFVVALILGYLLFKRIKDKKSNYLIALNLLVIPLFFGFFISKFFPMYFPGRHEAVVLPGFILVLAYLFSKIKNKVLVIAIIAVLIILACFSAFKEKKEISRYKNDERTAAEFLVENTNNNDLLIFTNLDKNTFDYYLPRINKSKNLFQANFPTREIEVPFAQSMEISRSRSIFAKVYYLIIDKFEKIKDMAGKNSKPIEYYDGFPEKSYEYIVKTIHDKKYNDIWVIYDSLNPVDRKFVNKLEKELVLVSSYDFTKTDIPDHLSINFQMLFNRIAQYKN